MAANFSIFEQFLGFPYMAANFSILDSGISPNKKIGGKKKGHKNHPKKRTRALPHCLLCWPAGVKKKKVGVEQGKVGRIGLANA